MGQLIVKPIPIRYILQKMKNRQLQMRLLGMSITIVLLVLTQKTYGAVTFVIENVMDFTRPEKCIYNLTRQQHSLETRPLPVSCQMEFDLRTIQNRSLENTNSVIFKDIPVVTAFSSNHFHEAKDAVASMQKYVPGHKIFVYDLGLSHSQITEIQTWCGVVYKQFDFSKFPAHVGNRLYACAWKPAVVLEMFLTYDAIFYFDASIRATCPDMLQNISKVALQMGLAVLDPAGHSVFVATDPHTYAYLNSSGTHVFKDMFGAGLLMLVNTKDIFNNILNWWVRCSMNVNCIAPYGSTQFCKFAYSYYRSYIYAHCHRYDQSALNLLMLKASQGRPKMYLAQSCAAVMRASTGMQTLQICNSRTK